MSISLTQSNSAETNLVTSQAVTLSSTLASGDLIIVAGRWGNQSGTITASDDSGEGGASNYAHITNSPISDGTTGGNEAFLMWRILSTGHSTLTITVSVATGGSHRLTVAAFDYHSTTGWAGSQPETSNINASGSSTNTSGTSGSITTTNTDLIFATVETSAAFGANGASVNSPFTIQNAGGSAGNGYASSNRSFGGDDQGAAAGSFNCTFNWATVLGWAAAIAAFTPSSGIAGTFEDDSFQVIQVQPVDPTISVW